MTVDLELEAVAAHALHKAQAFPEPSPEYQVAEKALDELLARNGGWKGFDRLNRDNRRLAKRYMKTLAEHRPDLVEHARSLGLLDTE